MFALGKSALVRAVWTALAVFLPMAATVISVDATPKVILSAVSAVSFAFVLSLMTSFAEMDLPEDAGQKYSKLAAIAIRALKTFVQSLLALFVADVMWWNFSWDIILQAVAATVVTLIRAGLMNLPEVDSLKS